MKKILSLLMLTCLINLSEAQVASTCTVPPLLAQEYERDIKNLVIRRLELLQSPDTALVQIPQSWQDTIAEGLAAIFNAFSIPERDSVFNLYCVHDNTNWPAIYQGLLVQVDTSYAWTQAWQNLTALTGNAYIDGLVNNYDLSVNQFFNWSFGNYALLHTDSLWNIYALIDSLEMEPGVIYGEPDAIIGGAGKIDYHTVGINRYYDFYFEFNDCFDGCDNYRKWQFRVNNDCSVDYLGFVDWGVFGISPLPPPVNCNTFTSLNDNNFTTLGTIVYPNPASSFITVQLNNNHQGIKKLTLYDVMGRMTTEIQTNATKSQVDITKLSHGIYSLVITDEQNNRDVHKVIKEQ